jgi:hypothetical protein
MPVPPIIILAAIMCGTAVVIATLLVVSRQVSQRRFTSQALSSDDIARRLERIEQAVETTAIEVERLAESNRFVAKLLSEKTGVPRS